MTAARQQQARQGAPALCDHIVFLDLVPDAAVASSMDGKLRHKGWGQRATQR